MWQWWFSLGLALAWASSQPEQSELAALTSLVDLGDTPQAARRCQDLLSAHPGSAQLHEIHARIHVAQQQPEQAVESLHAALRLEPQRRSVRTSLAQVLRSVGRLEQASEQLHAAVQLDPEDVATLHQHGVVREQLQDYNGALGAFVLALQRQPRAPELHHSLGLLLHGLGEHSSALSALEMAVQLAPSSAQALYHQGNTQMKLHMPREAVLSYSRALHSSGVEPQAADVYTNLGVALSELSRSIEAQDSHRHAVRLSSDSAQKHANLGSVFRDSGDRQRALEWYRKALALQPALVVAHVAVGELVRYTSHTQVQALQQLMQHSPAQGQHDRLLLHFGIGKAFADLAALPSALRSWRAGNALKRSLFPYDIHSDRVSFGHIKSKLSRERLPQLALSEPGSRITPVLVVGMPRSGSTLVEQILASHSGVHSVGEVPLLERALSLNVPSWREAPVNASHLIALRHAYTQALAARAPPGDAAVVLDKTLDNFRWVGLVLRAMPHAKVVHVQRSACASCWSMFRRDFAGASHLYASSWADLSEYYRLYQDLMQFWHDQFPTQVHLVQYERLVHAADSEIKKLAQFVGLPWESRMLQFHKSDRIVKTVSGLQVRRPLYRGSGLEWQQYADVCEELAELSREHACT